MKENIWSGEDQSSIEQLVHAASNRCLINDNYFYYFIDLPKNKLYFLTKNL